MRKTVSNKLLVSLFQYKAWANRELFSVLQSIPDGRHPTDMIVIVLTLDHVSTVDRIFQAHLIGNRHPFGAVVSSTMPKLSALWDTVNATDQWYVNYVQSVSQSELGEALDFRFVVDGLPGRMTREEMLGHVLTHGNSHRGAVGKMLEGLNVPAPSDMFTTFLHKERCQDRACQP
jgi:uncharacterized damage-inducible protein DinB